MDPLLHGSSKNDRKCGQQQQHFWEQLENYCFIIKNEEEDASRACLPLLLHITVDNKILLRGGRKLKYPAIWAFIVFNWTNTKQLTPENDRSKKYYILRSYFGFWANMKINQHIYFFANVAILGSVSEFIQIDPFICFKNAFIYPTNNRFNKKNIFV